MRKSTPVGTEVSVSGQTFRVAKEIPASAEPILPPDGGVVFVFPAPDGWRWHLSRKGRVLCDGGEPFPRPDRAEKSVERVFHGLYPVVRVEAL